MISGGMIWLWLSVEILSGTSFWMIHMTFYWAVVWGSSLGYRYRGDMTHGALPLKLTSHLVGFFAGSSGFEERKSKEIYCIFFGGVYPAFIIQDEKLLHVISVNFMFFSSKIRRRKRKWALTLGANNKTLWTTFCAYAPACHLRCQFFKRL